MRDFSIRLNTVELFCAAAKAKSFTAAATELGTTPSAISKAVQLTGESAWHQTVSAQHASHSPDR
jgi:Bacterial regulatory helix-turn-helix protein, lysR family